MIDYDRYDALGLAELVRQREVDAGELLQIALARVAERNLQVNAVVRDMSEQARHAIDKGLPQGPFTGVPYLLKDLRAQYGGVPTTAGSRLWRDWPAPHHSEIVRRLKQAGLVIFGKTNTSEFGCCPSTEGALYGATRNPWSEELSAGGSSGGSAAAVAAGMVPAAHGSDGGGSIRIPAACCGVFGFKPTRGINPSGPDVGEAWSGLSVEHALTRSVRDSAALLDATGGAAPGDPYRGPVLGQPLLDEVGRDPQPLRIAVQRHALSGANVHADCVAAVDDCVKLLGDLGHRVEEAAPTYDVARVGAAFTLAIAANVQASIDQYQDATGKPANLDNIENVIRVLLAIAREKNSADMVRATWAMHGAGRQIAPFFESYDVLLSPVVATPPPPLGVLTTDTDDVQAYLQAVFSFIPFTSLANIAGVPAMSVPLYWNAAGVPVGVHFMSGYGRDSLLFRLAGQLERARPWFGRRPPKFS